jgi:hypothetical protein
MGRIPQWPLLAVARGMNNGDCGLAQPSRDTSHGLNPEGKKSLGYAWWRLYGQHPLIIKSDVVLQAWGKAAASWGNAQAVTVTVMAR